MYAGRVARCPLASHIEYAPHAPLMLKEGNRRQTVTLRGQYNDKFIIKYLTTPSVCRHTAYTTL